MRVAIFGGSFDPVHKEHIALVKSALKSLDLDKLIVMPVACPPHKKGKTLSPDFHRLKTCKIAFADMPNVEVSDYEIQKGGVSYTYQTCEYFKTQYPQSELFWLVGTDMLRDFPTWKHPEIILQNVTLAVCARAEKSGWIETERKAFYEKFQTDFALVDYNGANVSSTKIRVLAGAGEDLSALVDEKVAEYIKENKLYAVAKADEALALESPSRKAHSLRVAETAAKKALQVGIDERQAVVASLFHDCAKNLPENSPLLKGFTLDKKYGDVPSPVLHQFTGAYLAENIFGVKDKDVLNAIRFHTSGRKDMSELEKLIFLADMLEESRDFDGVDELRACFWAGKKAGGLDECLEKALFHTVGYLQEKKADIYPLTNQAYAWIKNKRKGEKK